MEQVTRPVTPPSATGIREVQVARALLSVSDKTGIVEFARGLAELGIELIARDAVVVDPANPRRVRLGE